MRYISTFSGVEAASLAWVPLGWEPVAFSEIDPFPSAVLAERFPLVPNLGDITKVNWKKYRGNVDLVVGGSPCQSFSIAGKREGLKGESGLMFEFIRCVREVRPRWFLWENVPGALSVERGAAFGQLLSEMADGGGYGLAWRVLDAQFFGVAQRRRRLYLVGSAGNGYRKACQVLFEPEGMPWDYAPSRGKRAELAAGSQSGARSAGFCNPSAGAGSIGFREEQAATLRAGSNLASTGAVISLQSDGGTSQNGHGSGWSADGSAYTLNTADRQSVAIAANQRGEVRLEQGDGEVSGAVPASSSGKQFQGVLTPWDVQSKRVYSEGSTTGALPSGTTEGANIQPSVLQVVNSNGEGITGPVAARDYKGVGSEFVSEGKVLCIVDDTKNAAIDEDMAGTLKVGGGAPAITMVTRCGKPGGGKGALTSESVRLTLSTRNEQSLFDPQEGHYVVRRLTPLECERLQGMPDDWTRIPWKGRPAEECPDAPRYKAIGNSMAVPVIRWIGERIEMADKKVEGR